MYGEPDEHDLTLMFAAELYYDSFSAWINSNEKKELYESSPDLCKPALEIERMRMDINMAPETVA